MIDGLLSAVGPTSILAVVIGVLLGIAVGVLPGFTGTMGVALVLPFTFALDPGTALAVLGALYVAASFADSVPAVLVNTPGSPSAFTTAMDGYPMALRGEGQRALVASAASSTFGTIVGALVFLLLAAPLASVALRLGPPEFFWLGVFAMTLIGGIAGGSLLKGLAGGAFGLFLGTIGLAMSGSITRYTFDIPELRGGVDLIPAIVGVFALPQILAMVADRNKPRELRSVNVSRGVTWRTIKEMFARPANLIRSTVVGTIIGIIPGAGSSVASIVSYGEAKRWDKSRDRLGKGAVEGVVASESAGNAASAGAMVPTMGLGIPGSPAAAVILGALLIQGIQPGPGLFESDPVLVYGFAFAVMIAGPVIFVFGTGLARPLTRITDVPNRFLAPIVLFLSCLGAFAARSNIVDVYVMVAIGICVYLLGKVGVHAGPIGLGVVMGPIIEPALVESLSMANASSITEVFFARPISVVLIVLTIASVVWTLWSSRPGVESVVQKEVQHADQS